MHQGHIYIYIYLPRDKYRIHGPEPILQRCYAKMCSQFKPHVVVDTLVHERIMVFRSICTKYVCVCDRRVAPEIR